MSSSKNPKKFTPPASPTASYYDLSDNDDEEEVEYSTITHTSTGRGVKLLYSKSKVCFPLTFPFPPSPPSLARR